MRIVINEFEVIPTIQTPEPTPADGAQSAPPPVTAPVQDTEKISRRLQQRQARVRAH